MKLKTSTKISLKFTIFSSLILIIFAGLSNSLYFYFWHSNISNKITKNNVSGQGKMGLGRGRQNNVNEINKDSELGLNLVNNNIFLDISRNENEYYVYTIMNNNIRYTNISSHIDSQILLLQISFILILIFLFIIYFSSLFFVKSSLKSVNKLVNYAKKLDFNNLGISLEIEGPENDEIKILATMINKAISKINMQANSLKEFVGNASHELKTPLMLINSDIDYAIKAKKYEEGLLEVKENIKTMDKLIKTLLLITKLENINIFKEKTNISEIVNDIINDMNPNIVKKQISLELNIQNNIFKNIHEAKFRIIMNNLISNSIKYSNNGGKISIYLDNNNLYIQDNGKGIKKENLNNIWDRFRQEDEAKSDDKSFGLGLYIVKKLVELHKWTIKVENKLSHGTKFTILFNSNENINSGRQ